VDVSECRRQCQCQCQWQSQRQCQRQCQCQWQSQWQKKRARGDALTCDRRLMCRTPVVSGLSPWSYPPSFSPSLSSSSSPSMLLSSSSSSSSVAAAPPATTSSSDSTSTRKLHGVRHRVSTTVAAAEAEAAVGRFLASFSSGVSTVAPHCTHTRLPFLSCISGQLQLSAGQWTASIVQPWSLCSVCEVYIYICTFTTCSFYLKFYLKLRPDLPAVAFGPACR
jgi:hypothetical protein